MRDHAWSFWHPIATIRNILMRYIPEPSPGLALFFLLFGWYILTMSGHTYTSDEETMLAAGESLANKGTFALPLDFLMTPVKGTDGQNYSRYGPGQSLAAVPFLWVGNNIANSAPRYAGGFIIRLFVLLLPAMITAATALILYDWTRSMGYSTKVSILVGLLYGTSLAWPYSRTFFAEPLATFFLALCAYGMRREEHRWWIIAGFAAGCAMLVKLQAALFLPLIAGYAVLVCMRDRACPLCSLFGDVVGRAIMALVGMIIPLGFLLLYNFQIFGHPLKTGYGGVDPTGLLDGDWTEGLYGLLISTGKGILLYSPTIILGIIGLGIRWQQQWRESLLALAVLVVNVGFYSRLGYWHGDGSWGPRYMVFILPFLYLTSAGLVAILIRQRNRIITSLITILITVNLVIQLLPVLANFNTYIQMTSQYQRLFTPSESPIIGHARLWFDRASEWWLRVHAPAGTAVLRDGFSYSEGDRIHGELFPRWTYSDGRIVLYPAQHATLEGRIVVSDHRPWPLERAVFRLLLNGEALDHVQQTDLTGQHIVWELRFQLTPEQAHRGSVLTIHSDTWNPENTTPDNPRNEDLGLRVESLEFFQHEQPLQVREALPIPTIKRDRRQLWLWFYDTPNHHLFDAWLWYLFLAGLPTATIVQLLLLIALPGILMLFIGLRVIIAELRVPWYAE